MNDIIPVEMCTQCAECCKNYPFVELSEYEIDLLEQVTGLSFDLFTNPKRKVIEEYFLQFKENGHCVFLEKSNDKYSCSVYESRPAICRKFPSKPIQKEACYEYVEKIRKQL